MSDLKKFTSTCEVEMINKEDLIQTGDWLLKWSPHSSINETGFALFTPRGFQSEDKTGNPLGGIVLAAVFFLLEHSDSHGHNSFPNELIARANELSKEIEDNEKRKGSMSSPAGKTLN